MLKPATLFLIIVLIYQISAKSKVYVNRKNIPNGVYMDRLTQSDLQELDEVKEIDSHEILHDDHEGISKCVVKREDPDKHPDVQLYQVLKADGVRSSFTTAFFKEVCNTFGITHEINIPCPHESSQESPEHRRKCICDVTTKSLETHKADSIIILFVEETLGRYDQHVCNYTAHNKSPLFLQVFAGGVEVKEFALISIASPSGQASFQVRKELFAQQFPTVLEMVSAIHDSKAVYYNTVRKNDDLNYEDLMQHYRNLQTDAEQYGTSTAYVHLGLGIIIMIFAMVIGYITTDQSVMINFNVQEVKNG